MDFVVFCQSSLCSDDDSHTLAEALLKVWSNMFTPKPTRHIHHMFHFRRKRAAMRLQKKVPLSAVAAPSVLEESDYRRGGGGGEST